MISAAKAWMPSLRGSGSSGRINKSGSGGVTLAFEVFDAALLLLDSFANQMPLPPGTVRSVLYLDDSGSMSGPNLWQAHDMLTQLAPLLPTQTRVVKFGDRKSILYRGDEAWSASLVKAGWIGSSGGTFMWEMIKDDILTTYTPSASTTTAATAATGAGAGAGGVKGAGSGKLRVVIITDGYDTQSAGEFNGIDGMHPMMRDLRAAGFDVEFQIVLIGQLGAAVTRKYEELAAATSGDVLALTHPSAAASARAKEFLRRLQVKKQSEREALPEK